MWHLVRQISREPACDEIVSGLWIGRRPLSNDVPSGVSSIVDLTAEFSEPQRVRIGRTYRCLPILDTSIPEAEAFAKMVGEVAADGVLIHCAWGHGRSGLFAAAVLVARGLAATADDAIQQVRKARPRVRLNRAQRRFLIRYCESRAPTN